MLKFRQLHENDFLNLMDSCYPGYLQSRLFAELTRSLQRQTRGNAVHLLALWNDRLVGTAQLIHHCQRSEIAEVLVAREYRRQGVGTIMLNHLQDLAAEKGWLPVEIIVKANNPRARSLYERLGFHFERAVEIPSNEPADLLLWSGKLPVLSEPESPSVL